MPQPVCRHRRLLRTQLPPLSCISLHITVLSELNIACPCSELLEYKYLVTNAATGSVTWQPGSNMELTLNDQVCWAGLGWAGSITAAHSCLQQCKQHLVVSLLGFALVAAAVCCPKRRHVPVSVQSVKVLDSWLGQQHEVQLIPAEQTADAPADEAAPPDAAAKNDTEPAAEPSAEAPAVAQAAAPVTSTSITEAEDASCPPAAPAPNEEPSQPQPDAEDVAGSKPPEVAVGQAASSAQALPKPAAAAKPPPKRPAVPVRKPSPADKPWKSAVPAVAAAQAAGAATAPAAAHRGQPTPAAAASSIKVKCVGLPALCVFLCVGHKSCWILQPPSVCPTSLIPSPTRSCLQAEAHSAKEKAPSAAMPVVAAVVCFAIMAAAVAAGAPLLAAALSQLRLAAASVLRFLASLWRS